MECPKRAPEIEKGLASDGARMGGAIHPTKGQPKTESTVAF
jgi:hypothetical protein